ncbi:MAG: LPS export ABC transporter periplasmic protein LptC, partial [Ignavibacteriae bacterium]|nr:LPS export ABC transporter periplasmic protein LptC [Ignavibacteriota bacterium]
MKTLASIIFLLIFSVASLSAQQSGSNPTAGEPINLIYADSIVGKENANGSFRFAQGHVQFKQGNVFVWCDRANDYQKENRIELMGNVKIVQGTVTLTSPKADYNGNTRIALGNQGVKIVDRKTTLTAKTGKYSTQTVIANFYGDVRIEDDSVAIDADTIEYHRSTENSYASGNILMNAKYSHAFIKGDSSVNFPSMNYSRVVGNAVLYQMD